MQPSFVLTWKLPLLLDCLFFPGSVQFRDRNVAASVRGQFTERWCTRNSIGRFREFSLCVLNAHLIRFVADI